MHALLPQLRAVLPSSAPCAFPGWAVAACGNEDHFLPKKLMIPCCPGSGALTPFLPPARPYGAGGGYNSGCFFDCREPAGQRNEGHDCCRGAAPHRLPKSWQVLAWGRAPPAAWAPVPPPRAAAAARRGAGHLHPLAPLPPPFLQPQHQQQPLDCCRKAQHGTCGQAACACRGRHIRQAPYPTSPALVILRAQQAVPVEQQTSRSTQRLPLTCHLLAVAVVRDLLHQPHPLGACGASTRRGQYRPQ